MRTCTSVRSRRSTRQCVAKAGPRQAGKMECARSRLRSQFWNRRAVGGGLRLVGDGRDVVRRLLHPPPSPKGTSYDVSLTLRPLPKGEGASPTTADSSSSGRLPSPFRRKGGGGGGVVRNTG